MTDTYYHFLPSLRSGLATAIQAEAPGKRAEIEVRVLPAGRSKSSAEWDADLAHPIARTVQLYGPGDIAGFDERMVVRTEPKPDSGNFEPNYFPAIEFADPDFVWRFSAAPAGARGLTPWIVLVVLVAENRGDAIRREFEELPRSRDQSPAIRVLSQTSLPNLANAWQWAHVQATGGDAALGANEERSAEIRRLMQEQPELVVSHLLCPRRLAPQTRYNAFVVPAYLLGWAAGLGTAEAFERARDATAVDLAWEGGGAGAIDLPYYFRWEFRTSERGDFEFLVRLLEPRKLKGLGLREIDCERPGFGLTVERQAGESPAKKHRLDMEGALQSLDTEYTRWGKDQGDLDDGDDADVAPDPNDFQTRLAAELLNRANANGTEVVLSAAFDPADLLGRIAFDVLSDGKTVRFTWRTANPTTGRVEYGEEGVAEVYDGAAESVVARTEHAVDVALTPERKYHFRIVVIAAGGAETPTGDATIRVLLPLVVPPIYGRWHAARASVVADAEHDGWIDTLNLDPRHRSAAGLGAEVVRKQQEGLMASAWDQLGAVEAANETLRRAQFGREDSLVLHSRLGAMALEDFLRNTAPAQKRILRTADDGARRTVPAEFAADTRLLAAALDPAFRRISRARGPIRKRQGARPMDLFRRLATGELSAAGPVPKLPGTTTVCDVSRLLHDRVAPSQLPSVNLLAAPAVNAGRWSVKLTWSSERASSQTASGDLGWGGAKEADGSETIGPRLLPDPIFVPGDLGDLGGGGGGTWRSRSETFEFRLSAANAFGMATVLVLVTVSSSGEIVAEREVLLTVPTDEPGQATFCPERLDCGLIDTELPAVLDGPDLAAGERVAEGVCPALDVLQPGVARPEKPVRDAAFLQELRNDVHAALDPNITVPARTKKRLRLAGTLGKRFDEGAPGDPLDEIMAYPEFPLAMYEPLRDLAEAHVLPGVETVPQNTIGVLETNGRFVESYMVGLNHEFAGELLWRRYPTDQRGSYFRQFWNVSEYVGKANPDPVLSELDANGELKPSVREALKDIRPLHEWDDTHLGDNDNRSTQGKGEMLVLVVRGDLLKRYPNAIVYAVNARRVGEDLWPRLAEFPVPEERAGEIDEADDGSPAEPEFPIFRGSLGADLVFMGFSFTEAEAKSSEEQPGKFFVLEERVTEARFGLDTADNSVPMQHEPVVIADWSDLHWGHFQLAEEGKAGGYVDASPITLVKPDAEQWNADTDAALRARITLQRPARLAVHADQMIPDNA